MDELIRAAYVQGQQDAVRRAAGILRRAASKRTWRRDRTLVESAADLIEQEMLNKEEPTYANAVQEQLARSMDAATPRSAVIDDKGTLQGIEKPPPMEWECKPMSVDDLTQSERDVMSVDYTYKAFAQRVIDGDSYHLRIDLGFHAAVTVPVRLRGIDTPELNTDAGKAARQFVVDLLQPANLPMEQRTGNPTPLIVQSYRDRQSFARWIVDVWLVDPVDQAWIDRSLADYIIEAGHGRRA